MGSDLNATGRQRLPKVVHLKQCGPAVRYALRFPLPGSAVAINNAAGY